MPKAATIAAMKGSDDERISSALGHLSHFVFMLAKYLEIPLRYRVLLCASRSAVCDDVASFSQFPLFFRNSEEKRFEHGCLLMQSNIEHLLNMRAPDWRQKTKRPPASMLEALDLLLQHELPVAANVSESRFARLTSNALGSLQ